VSLPFKAARHHRTMQDGGDPEGGKKLFFGHFLPRKNMYFSAFEKKFYYLLVYLSVICKLVVKNILVYFINLFTFAPSIEQKKTCTLLV